MYVHTQPELLQNERVLSDKLFLSLKKYWLF